MNSKKPKWKRLLSSLLMLAMLATLFPVSAFAITYQEATLSPHNFAVDENGNFTTDLNLPDGFDEEVSVTQEGNTFEGPNWKLPETLKVNLWVDSKSMSDEENGTAPYVKDVMGRTWTLSKISITNKSTPEDGQTLIELLDTSSVTSKSNYVVDLSNIELEPRILGNRFYYYDIYYLWELTEGDPAPTQYQVTYDLNLPSELSDSKTLFPVYREGDRETMDVLSEDGQLYVVEKAVDALSGSVYENVQFTVADFSYTLYVDFLVFDENSYYDFDGWYIDGHEDTLYQTGDVLTAGNSLAGSNNTISFKGKWTEIDLLTDEGLEAAKSEIRTPILSSDTRNVADNVLITQWTDTDANLSGNLKSGETVMLDEDRTIYYQLSATVNSALYSSYFSPTTMPPEDFMTFTLSLDVDDDLEFVADDNGQATLTFNSPIFKVTETNIENANFSEYPDKNGDSTITFDPDNIPDGNVITVTVKWNEKVENNHIAPSGTMTLSGFAFKLKGGTASKDMVISTSGNITGSLDLKKPNGINQRYYYQTVLNLLNSNFYGYQEAFGGDASNPTAYVHAMQFTDLVTSKYDLSQDTKAVLNDNTVTATVVQSGSIVIRPADITVYEGGDGGYDAVVDGTETTTSDSLPHPMFHIDAPEGVDPAGLTFHNGNKSWAVISDGNDYYHFSEGDGQDKVRVTYSYTDEDDVKHTVTEDAFDPATMGEVYGKLTIELYPGENNLSDVTATTKDGKTYRITANTGTLTVRAVENSDATSDIEETAPATKLDPNTAMAVEPEGGTTYTLNDTGVRLPTDSLPSLLFDDIIDTDADRTSALEDRIDSYLGGADVDREYQIKYLDLVDANNGNAWITSSAGTDIYWGYPTGTDRNTNFTLLHFTGLHRDGTNSGFDLDDIAGAAIERIDVENTENGIKFHVDAGGFSPFALVWEERGPIVPPTTYYTITATAGEGGAIAPDGTVRVAQGADRTFTISAAEGYVIADVLVDGESIGAVDSYTFENVRQNHTIEARFQPVSDVADPDDTGVSDWLNTDDHLAYLDGYPDNTFQPEEDMTRAEAAQMFYNLLRDQDVDTTVSFTDVAADAWYAEAVNTLATLEIVDGVGDNRFAPERTITRAEFTTMAMRFCQEIPTGENIFSDVDQDDWFYDYVVGSIQYGWINGYPDGTFRPNDTITRAEVTTIANRMLGRAADEAYVDGHQDQLRAFPDVTKGYWAYYDITEATNAHEYTKDSQGEDWTGLA